MIPTSDTHAHRIESDTARTFAASAIGTVMSLLRYKAIALTMGPAGIGLYGLMLQWTTLLGTAAGLGLPISLIPALGQTDGRARRQAVLILYVLLAVLVTGGLTSTAAILARPAVVRVLPSEIAQGAGLYEVVWVLPFLLAFSVVSAAIMGLRDTRSYFWITVTSSTVSTGIGVALMQVAPEAGLIVLVVLQHVIGCIAGLWVLHARGLLAGFGDLKGTSARQVLHPLFGAGAFIMAASAVTVLGLLSLQAAVAHWQGLGAVGALQASHALSLQALGFIAISMQSNLMPGIARHRNQAMRVAALSRKHASALSALAIFILIALGAVSGMILTLFFSEAFGAYGSFLLLWLIGDCLKVPGWVLGARLISQQRSGAFFWCQCLGNIAFVAFGIAALWAGADLVAVACANLVLTGVTFASARCFIGPSRPTGLDASCWGPVVQGVASLALLFCLSVYWPGWTAPVGLGLLALFTIRHRRVLRGFVRIPAVIRLRLGLG